jgi:methylthioribulose-1-phosphate dehydratase
MPSSGTFGDLSIKLAAVGQRFYQRHWVLGTSGNFSAVVSQRPFRLAITPSAAHKGTLTGAEMLEIDDVGRVIGHRAGRPSAETLLHLEIVKLRGAAAVLHTHSVWGTILSDLHARRRGLAIRGYEMLKGLEGVGSHRHREWIPIIDNDQDMTRLASAVRIRLAREPAAHAFLLRAHGLYTWGATLAQAERHVEILEFLLEAVGRREAWHGYREDSGAEPHYRGHRRDPRIPRGAAD